MYNQNMFKRKAQIDIWKNQANHWVAEISVKNQRNSLARIHFLPITDSGVRNKLGETLLPGDVLPGGIGIYAPRYYYQSSEEVRKAALRVFSKDVLVNHRRIHPQPKIVVWDKWWHAEDHLRLRLTEWLIP